jgi:hypothetical protein
VSRYLFINIENDTQIKSTWINLEADKFPEWTMMQKYADTINPRTVMDTMETKMPLPQRIGTITAVLPLNEIVDFNYTKYMQMTDDANSIVAVNLSIRELEKIVRATIAGFFMKVIAKSIS